jgi:PadR family transcriptional regulator, regulatory protein PadR
MAVLLGTFEQIVLMAVMISGDEAYGRSVLRAVEASFAGERSVSAGAISATLDRLEAEGLVSSRQEKGTPSRGGRSKRFYRVTPQGIAALGEVKATLERMWRGIAWPREEME